MKTPKTPDLKQAGTPAQRAQEILRGLADDPERLEVWIRRGEQAVKGLVK